MTKSKVIDRIFPGVGRISRASGTDHAGTFKRINAMLTGLHKIGRLDVLIGIRDGVWPPLVVLHHYERGQLDRLPKAESAATLVEAMRTFVANHQCGKSHRQDMETSVRHLERAKGGKRATIADLPTLLRDMKPGFKDRPVAFNRLRAHALGFVSEAQGKHSPLWIEVTRVNRYKKADGRPRKLLRRPLTVVELDQVCAAFVDHPVYAGKRGGGRTVRRTILADDLARMARTLATTGMRPQEYWEREGAWWEIRTGYIHVEGTKTTAARRPTFHIVIVAPAECGEQFFRERFAEATTKALRVGLDAYSLRRTFASLCESAGIEASRAKAYLGHGPKTVTDLYLRTNVLPFVQQDAERVTAWIQAERERAAARPSIALVSNEVT